MLSVRFVPGIILDVLCTQSLGHVSLFRTPWTIAHQAPLSMGFSRQEYWSGLPFPSPGDLPEPGTKPVCPVSPALQSDYFTTEPQGCPLHMLNSNLLDPSTSYILNHVRATEIKVCSK